MAVSGVRRPGTTRRLRPLALRPGRRRGADYARRPRPPGTATTGTNERPAVTGTMGMTIAREAPIRQPSPRRRPGLVRERRRAVGRHRHLPAQLLLQPGHLARPLADVAAVHEGPGHVL